MQKPPIPTDQELQNELSFYTLAHPSPAFIHQHIVDAYAVQKADDTTKPITIVFALLGLYLHVEKNFTGKQVQKAHMQLAKHRREWFRPPLPDDRGTIVVADVVAAAPGPQRDAMIHNWCVSVWEACGAARQRIVELAKNELGVS
ncbi:MAG TPA: DUF5946 family protein [Terriglobales bacterium]|nr:DUF5946 family protein [Terriglobales bacterium]